MGEGAAIEVSGGRGLMYSIASVVSVSRVTSGVSHPARPPRAHNRCSFTLTFTWSYQYPSACAMLAAFK
jgi:hypothetical protein